MKEKDKLLHAYISVYEKILEMFINWIRCVPKIQLPNLLIGFFPHQFCRKCSQNTREKLPTVSRFSIYKAFCVVSIGFPPSLVCFEEEIKGINSSRCCDVSHWAQHISNSNTSINFLGNFKWCECQSPIIK